jgi:CBS domain-containing protein
LPVPKGGDGVVTGSAYGVIEIFTSEQARWKGSPVYDAIVQAVAQEKTATRCIVARGVAGCFENGEVASHRVLDLSHNMPLKIEIILPMPELERVLGRVEPMVADGIVMVRETAIRLHRTAGALLPRGLKVRDVMTTSPLAVRRDASIEEVSAVLIRSEFDALPVTDERGRLVGMAAHDNLDKAGAISAGDVMEARVFSVRPSDSLGDAVEIMAQRNLKRLPVVGKDGHLEGVLSRIDVLRAASAGTSRRRVLQSYGVAVPGSTAVDAAKLLDIPSVSPETPALSVIDLIDNEGERVVVVNEEGAPMGIIADRDLLPLLGPEISKARHLSAGDLMTAVPVITRETSIDQALELMVEQRIKRLPVVDDRGRYLGTLGREQVLHMIAQDSSHGDPVS